MAVGKYRTLHGEYKRVQRDYEVLQGIVRESGGGGGGGGGDGEAKEAKMQQIAVMQQKLISKDEDMTILRAELEEERDKARRARAEAIEGGQGGGEDARRMAEEMGLEIAKAQAHVRSLPMCSGPLQKNCARE